MVVTPAYIIGLGAFGTNVVRALRDRSNELANDDRSGFGFMSIAADRSVLEYNSRITTVTLTSDSGIVRETVSGYPYLTKDISVPANREVRRRHVGRYKLDNPDQPTFLDFFKRYHRYLEQFIEQQSRSTSRSQSGKCTVVLVTSLGDGTGSGILPLVTAALAASAREIEDTEIRLVGLGTVPPLDIDPKESYPPADPVSYLNTYASFRNLMKMTCTDDGESLDVPFYSWGTPYEESTDDTMVETEDEAQKVLQVTKPAFDTFWLMSQSDESVETHSCDFARTVGNALYATLGHTSQVAGFQTRVNESPLGTLGYSALGVAHEDLRKYCDRKREHERIRTKIDEFVKPRIEALRDKKNRIERSLHAQVQNHPLSPKLIRRLYGRLEENPADAYEFVKDTTPEELDAVLDNLAEEPDTCSYFLTTSVLEWSLSSGSISSTVHETVAREVSAVQEKHDLTPVTGSNPGTLSAVKDVENQLETQREQEEREAQGETTTLDLVPLVGDLFTNPRERDRRDPRRIEESLARMESSRATLERLEELHRVCRNRKPNAHERVRDELKTVEDEIEHYRSRKTKLEEREEQLNAEVISLRDDLTSKRSDGPMAILALDNESFDNLTAEDVDTLSSLSDYVERGLLDVSQQEFTRRIIEHCEESRAWPEDIARHESSVAIHGYDETALLYSQENESIFDTDRVSTAISNLSFPSRADTEYTDDPYAIEMVSTSQGGRFESLRGFERLADLYNRGQLQALAGPYRDYRRALAYPEWYDDVGGAFE